MAINDGLTFKAARRYIIAKWEFLGPRDTSDLISTVPFTFAMRRQFIPLAKIGHGNHGKLLRKVDENSCPIFRHLA